MAGFFLMSYYFRAEIKIKIPYSKIDKNEFQKYILKGNITNFFYFEVHGIKKIWFTCLKSKFIFAYF